MVIKCTCIKKGRGKLCSVINIDHAFVVINGAKSIYSRYTHILFVHYSLSVRRTPPGPPHKHRITDLPMPPAVDYPKSKPRYT